MQDRRDLGLGPPAAAAVQRAVGQGAGIHTGQRTHRPDLGTVGGIGGVGHRLQILGGVGVHRHGRGGVGFGSLFHLGVHLHIHIPQGDLGDGAVVFAHQTYIVVVLQVVSRGAVAGFACHRGAAQLQVADHDMPAARSHVGSGAGQHHVFVQRGDGGPGHHGIPGAAGYLGGGLAAILGRAVNGHAAVGPVQRGVGGLVAEGVGGGLGRLLPPQVVQVTEIFQRSAVGITAAHEQRVLDVGAHQLALGQRILIGFVGAGAHLCIDVLGPLGQPGDAEQRGSCGNRIVLCAAQQRGIAHGVQRQDKAALAVAERERIYGGGILPGAVLVGKIHINVCVFEMLGSNIGVVDLQLEQRLVAVRIVKFGVVDGIQIAVGAVAAPVQGQRFVVDEQRVLDLQAGLGQLHHIDGIVS